MFISSDKYNIVRRSLYILTFALLGCLFAKSQDPHFSQFFASPITLNPAYTGNFEGNMRICGNYRNQWPSINRAYTTATASVDFPIMRNRLAENDRWGVGLLGLTDQQADGVLKNNYLSLSTAFHKGLDGEGMKRLTIGFQATYANKNLNTTNLKFEDQLRSDGFTGITNEIFQNNQLSISYMDLNTGILFSNNTYNGTSYYIGASLYHLNRPNESFRGGEFHLAPRYTAHAGLYLPLNDNVILHTSGLFQSQAGAHETVIGGALGYTFPGATEDNPTTFYAGSWCRFGDAFIPYIGLEFGKFRLGASYDVNTSSLKSVSNSRGGFELSLIYINRPSSEHSLPCPKF